MADKDLEVKPLAPAAHRIISIDYYHNYHDAALSMDLKKRQNRKYIKCCGCFAALILITAVIILVLSITVFHLKNPVLNMNSETIKGLDRVNKTTLPRDTNLTVTASFSVKNPNVAAFKFVNVTTSIYYGGIVVGEGWNPSGAAKAGQTLRMNMTVEIMVDKLMAVPRWRSDLSLGALNMSSYTRISGRVKIMKIYKRDVEVCMNCTMTVNITIRGVQDLICNYRRISI